MDKFMTAEIKTSNVNEAELEAKAKSADDIRNEIAEYRRLIKFAEAQNKEDMVLSNEDKLRQAEKELQNLEAAKKREEEMEKNAMAATDKGGDELKENIAALRENIKQAEKADNEQLVLENEAKLREAEQMLRFREAEDDKDKQLADIRQEIKKEAAPAPEILASEGEFVEADPGLPIIKRLTNTPDGVQNWQLQYTGDENVIKINRGWGWGEVSKSKLEKLFQEFPVRQAVEDLEEISDAAYDQIENFSEISRQEREKAEKLEAEKAAEEERAKTEAETEAKKNKKASFWKNLSSLLGGVNEKK